MYIIVGLGNPGTEYENTRHSAGRMVLSVFAKKNAMADFQYDKKLNAQISEGKVGNQKILLVMPDTFMNKSGETLRKIKGLDFKSKKKNAEKEIGNLIVVHDDLDIPFGKFKISFRKSSGGHKGVESLIKAVKTENFVRVRVGISPSTAGGKLKKPIGEDAVSDYILAKFKPSELLAMKKITENVAEAIEMIIMEGKEKAMGKWNG